MYLLIEDTNIQPQTNWSDGDTPVAEPANHLLLRRLKVEQSPYVLNPGELLYTPSSTVSETEESIEKWCVWSELIGRDFYWMIERFREYRDVFGYPAYNDHTKKILLKHFSGGPGNDYIDPLFTQDEYNDMYHDFEMSLTGAFIFRDKLVYQKMRKRVYQGTPTKSEATKTANAIAFLRDNYIRDFFMAKAIDETDGVIDFLNNDNTFQFQDIDAADGVQNRYTINNFNIRSLRKYLGDTVQITGSTGGINDGFFALEDWGKSGGDSWVEIPTITDPNAAELGQIVLTGLKAFDGMSDAIRDECLDVYLNGA